MDPLFNAEQALAAIRDLAAMVHAYYKELLDQGFNRTQAMTLSIEYQKVLLGGLNNDSKR